MGKKVWISGALLIFLGFGIIFLSTISSIFGIFDREENTLIDETDFTSENGNVYQSEFDIRSIDDEIMLSIEGKNEKQIGVDIIITDEDNVQLFHRKTDTPMKNKIPTNSRDEKCKITIEVIDSQYSFNDLNIEITTEDISTFGTLLCCSWFLLIPLSILMIIFGITMLIINFFASGKIKKIKDRNKEKKLQEKMRLKDLELKRKEEINKGNIERKQREIDLKNRQIMEQERIKQNKINMAEKYERAERFEDAAKIYDELGMIDKANIIRKTSKIHTAQKYERAERFEDAAKIYEKLNMWDEAGRSRRKGKGVYQKNINVDVNKLISQIRSGGLTVPYNCPQCGGSLKIDGTKKIVSCPYCNAPLDTDSLSDFIKAIL